ncbi:MAG: HAD family hydrolase [Thermaerobacter sp.]|nr:HAD family hydrolase [Thermaerobacter sp.]
MIRAVIFDFDGTVADTLPLLYGAFRQVFWEFGEETLTDQEIAARFGPPEEKMLAQYLPADRFPAAVARFFELYEEGHERLAMVRPSVVHLLTELSSRGLLSALVSNKGRRSMIISLARTGLGRWFPVVVTGDEVSRTKPDPEGIHLALSALAVRPDQAIYVGDSGTDIQAARRAGLAAAVHADWMTWHGAIDNNPADLHAKKPDDLLAWLDGYTHLAGQADA